MSTFQNTKQISGECAPAMEKVTWPDREQLQNATWVVIIFTILISAIIWIMDMISRFVIVDLIMSLFGA